MKKRQDFFQLHDVANRKLNISASFHKGSMTTVRGKQDISGRWNCSLWHQIWFIFVILLWLRKTYHEILVCSVFKFNPRQCKWYICRRAVLHLLHSALAPAGRSQEYFAWYDFMGVTSGPPQVAKHKITFPVKWSKVPALTSHKNADWVRCETCNARGQGPRSQYGTTQLNERNLSPDKELLRNFVDR